MNLMTLNDLTTNLLVILPITVLFGWCCLLLLVDLWIPACRKWLTGALAAMGLALALGIALSQAGTDNVGFNGMVEVDNFAVFLEVLFLSSGLFAIALSHDYLRRMEIERGEYYVLLLFSIAGMMLMSIAADLIIVFLSLELLSLPLYILAGFARPKLDSEEAALKYFLLGVFSGGILLYGVALIFGASQTTSLYGVLAAAQAGSANLILLTLGAALLLIGLGFKVAAVPFHMWTPDVYHGAPSAVTAFMAAGAKAAGFAALLRILVIALPDISADLTPILWGLAALTVIVGNFLAIAQVNIKRMLAYSSIAHAGYLLMALAAYGQTLTAANDAVSAVLFYLAAFTLSSFGAWAVVIALEKTDLSLDSVNRKGLLLEDYAGLGRKRPMLAAAMSVFMLSFTGVPPTLGFTGKFFLFRALLEVNAPAFVVLALIGVLTSLISAYYYLRVVVIMYMRPGEPEVRSDVWLNLTAGVTAAATVLFSLFAAPLFRWAAEAILH
jgi:NADH-quinone oxidoreductase subunit N